MKNEELQEMRNELYKVLAWVDAPEKISALLTDLCTFKEIDQMAQRIKCAGLLLDGLTYNQVMAKTDISSATLCRVSRCIQHGSGGYSEILKEFREGKNAD